MGTWKAGQTKRRFRTRVQGGGRRVSVIGKGCGDLEACDQAKCGPVCRESGGRIKAGVEGLVCFGCSSLI